jgi:hypothetical protein
MVCRILSPDDLPEEPFDADRTFARCVAAGLLLGVVFILSESHATASERPTPPPDMPPAPNGATMPEESAE